MVYLNNRPYYLKLVLDQGYYKDGLLSAPSDQHLIDDIVLFKKMGFNGCRKHQKIEEKEAILSYLPTHREIYAKGYKHKG